MAIIIRKGKKPRKHLWSDRYYICNYCHTIYYMEGDDEILEAIDDQMDGIMVRVECSTCEEERWIMNTWPEKYDTLHELGLKKEE